MNKLFHIIMILFLLFVFTGCMGKQKFTVSFDSQGGSAVSEVTVEKGSTITLSTPIKDGYDFLGWFIDLSYSEQFTSSSLVDKDITLYA